MVRLGLLYWPTPTTVYNAIANNSIDPSLRELIAELDGFPLVLSDAAVHILENSLSHAQTISRCTASHGSGYRLQFPDTWMTRDYI
jgi:hypothetical protein